MGTGATDLEKLLKAMADAIYAVRAPNGQFRAVDRQLSRHLADAALVPVTEALAAQRQPDHDGMDEATEARWQQRIYDRIKEFIPDVDGSGCESGDALDVTMTEINMLIGYFEDKIDALAHPPNELGRQRFCGYCGAPNSGGFCTDQTCVGFNRPAATGAQVSMGAAAVQSADGAKAVSGSGPSTVHPEPIIPGALADSSQTSVRPSAAMPTAPLPDSPDPAERVKALLTELHRRWIVSSGSGHEQWLMDGADLLTEALRVERQAEGEAILKEIEWAAKPCATGRAAVTAAWLRDRLSRNASKETHDGN